MRRKAYQFLMGMLVIMAVISLVAGIFIEKTNTHLKRLSGMHRMDMIHHSVVDSFYSVSKAIGDMGAGDPPTEINSIVEDIAKIHRTIESCNECHHSADTEAAFKAIGIRIDSYEEALSFFITTSADRHRAERLGIKATGLGGELLKQIESLSRKADEKMHDSFTQMLELVRLASYITFLMLVAVAVIGGFLTVNLVRSISGPVGILIEGTRKISDGELGYEIKTDGDGEFAELAKNFNRMSVELHSAYDELEKRNQRLGIEIEEHRKADRERHRLAEELMQARKMEAVGTLAGGIAHEFNNLLQVIQGSAEVLLNRLPEDESNREKIKVIVNASERGADLTKRLLTFSRRIEAEMRPHDLCQALMNLTEVLRDVLPSNIAVKLLPDKCPVWAIADLNALEQVLLNLTMNAKDAMPHGGELTISVSGLDINMRPPVMKMPERAPGVSLIEITDNGKGIPPEVREKIFEPFFTTKAVGAATGLGLAVAYGVVQAHGGHLECVSKPGMGTSFRIWLPMIKAANGGTDEPAGHASGNKARQADKDHPGEGRKVLVIENDPFVGSNTADLLKRMGYKPLLAADMEEFQKLAAGTNGNGIFVLLDSGWDCDATMEALIKITPIASHMSVLAFAESGDQKLARKMKEAGAAIVLVKPLRISDLLRAADKLGGDSES